jgi:hypothetical protein
METLDIIAGLAWDPEIRGFLSVLTGVVVLCGSVWLLLSTNSGIRLGSLIALAGFFGWMAIMGVVWWIYGIGYAGDAPSWELVEIVESSEEGDLYFAALDEANQLQSEEFPPAFDVVVASDDEVALAEFGPVSEDTLTADQTAGLTDEEIDELVVVENAKNEATTLSELAAVSPDLIDQDAEELGGWVLLSTAQAGEAQASALAFLLESDQFEFGAQNEVKTLDAFDYGGKDPLPADPSRWDRISHQITTAVQLTHPTHYGIVQFQAVTEESLESTPGEAPPPVFADESEPVISVIMIRNLGNLRFVPAMVTIGSFLIFCALCYMLHVRDKTAEENRAQFEAGIS